MFLLVYLTTFSQLHRLYSTEEEKDCVCFLVYIKMLSLLCRFYSVLYYVKIITKVEKARISKR
jgi:hypothetical protein